MKEAMTGEHANAKISKEAKETVQEWVSEFISFITSEAWDKWSEQHRKTINGDDIIFAIEALGFEAYMPGLKQFLQKYRETHKNLHPDNEDGEDEEQDDEEAKNNK